jgi:hypothetical protein
LKPPIGLAPLAPVSPKFKRGLGMMPGLVVRAALRGLHTLPHRLDLLTFVGYFVLIFRLVLKSPNIEAVKVFTDENSMRRCIAGFGQQRLKALQPKP